MSRGRLLVSILGAVCTLLILSGGALSVQTGHAQSADPGIRGPFHGTLQPMPVAPSAAAAPSTNAAQSPAQPLPTLFPRGAAELAKEKAAASSGAPAPTNHGPIPAAAAPAAGAGQGAAAASSGFEGITSVQSYCHCLPPDGSIAVGPRHVVGAVNTAFEVWDKQGAVLLPPVNLATFFVGDPNYTDPTVAYDVAADRFVLEALTYLGNDSFIDIAVSATSDPTGAWRKYAIPVDPRPQVYDFPHLAIGSDALYLSGNVFAEDVNHQLIYSGARLYALDKAGLYSGQGGGYTYFDLATTASGAQADTLTPVQAVGVPGTMYFIAADNCNACKTITLWRWANAVHGGLPTRQGGVQVAPYNQPPNAPQAGSGSLISTNDVRNLSAWWYRGTVYGVHTIACDPGNGPVACVQWYQLGNLDSTNPAGRAPSLVQQGIIGDAGRFRYFPALSVDRAGDLSIGYAFSSAADFAGIRRSSRTATDAPGTLAQETLVKAGAGPVDGSRYGDYAGETVDLDGCTIWHLEEYARGDMLWSTWVASWVVQGCSLVPVDLPIYTDSLSPGWFDASYNATVDYAASAPVYMGIKAISVTVTAAYGALDIHTATAVNVTPYSALTFAARATNPGQQYVVWLVDQNDDQLGVQLSLADYGGQPPAGSWQRYTIPLSALGVSGQRIWGVVIQDDSGGPQPPLYVDEIAFAGGDLPPRPTVTGVSPSSGPNTGGTAVVVEGTGFSPTPGGTVVRFGASTATPQSGTQPTCSSTECVVFTPPGSGTVDVTVTVDGQTSAAGSADRYTYVACTDGNRAQITNPSGGSIGTSTPTIDWNSGRCVSAYWLYAGSSFGTADLFSSGQLPASATSATITPAIPVDGRMIYVRLWSLVNGGWLAVDRTYVMTTCYAGTKADISSPAPGTLHGASQTFQWTGGTCVTEYWLYLGSAYGSADLYSSGALGGTVTAQTVTLPANGSTVYLRLWSLVSGTWQAVDRTYVTGP